MALTRLLLDTSNEQFPFLSRTSQKNMVVQYARTDLANSVVAASWIENLWQLPDARLAAVVKYHGIAPALPSRLISCLATEYVRSYEVKYNFNSSTLLVGQSFWATLTSLGWIIHEQFESRQAVSCFTLKSVSYLHRAGTNIKTYGAVSTEFDALVDFPVSGIDITKMQSIIGCISYMVATDGTTIYWSSPLNPEYWAAGGVGDDAGAGATRVLAVRSTIKFLKPAADGFYAFTTSNIIYARYTGNPDNPWLFTEVTNSTGTYEDYNIVNGINTGNLFIWSDSGFVVIEGGQAKYAFPQLTELLAGSVYESYNSTTKRVDSIKNAKTTVGIYFLNNRFLCVSYGEVWKARDYILMYDLLTERWSRFKLPHAGLVTYHDPADQGYRFVDWETTFEDTILTFDDMFTKEASNVQNALTLVVVTEAGEITRLTPVDYALERDELHETEGSGYPPLIFDDWEAPFFETLQTFEAMAGSDRGYTFEVLPNVLAIQEIAGTRNTELDLQEVTLYPTYENYEGNTSFQSAEQSIVGYSDQYSVLRTYMLATDKEHMQTYTQRVRGHRVSAVLENINSTQGIELAVNISGTRR